MELNYKGVLNLIGLVIVSHSSLIADGTKELALQMADPALKIIAAGGTSDGKLGTDMKKIKSAIEKVNGPEGVLILTDLGSSVLTTEMVIDMLDEDNKDISKIKIGDIFSIKKTVEDIVIKKVPV